MSNIILASGSPRRQELLKLVTEDFEICPVDADETIPEGMPIQMAAAFLADLKASSCAKLFPDKIVIGCDTIVVHEDEIMGKPKDREDAFRMLRRLSSTRRVWAQDRRRTVMFGCCLVASVLRMRV